MIHTYKRQAGMEIFLMQLLEVSLSDDFLGGFHYLLHETLTPLSKMKQKVIKILLLQKNKSIVRPTTFLVTKSYLL